MKKLLSLVLALALVLTAVTAFAAGNGNIELTELDKDKNGVKANGTYGSGGDSISSGAQIVVTIINIDSSINNSYNQTQGTTSLTEKVYSYTNAGKESYSYTTLGKEVYSNVHDGTKESYSFTTLGKESYSYTSEGKESYSYTTLGKETNNSYTYYAGKESYSYTTLGKETDRSSSTLKDKDYTLYDYDNSSRYIEKAGDTIYLGSFNDQSVRDSYNDNSDNSDNSVTEANTTEANTTTTTQNTDSGNSSASASASAAAAAGETKKSAGTGSGSASKSSGSASGSAGSGTSGASSSAKAVAVAKASSSGSGSGSSSSSTVVAPSIQLVVVPDTAETTALKNAFAEAIKAGDPKTALPENISSKLSADLKTVNEFVTAKLVGDITGIASATVNIQFPTKYAAGDKVVVLFGIPNGDTTQWINVNGIIESDGSISMILTSTVLEALAGKTFALAVLSK